MMGRYERAVDAGPNQLRPPKEPLTVRSLATALAIGAPVGIIVWLAVQEMPNITWVVSELFMRAAQ